METIIPLRFWKYVLFSLNSKYVFSSQEFSLKVKVVSDVSLVELHWGKKKVQHLEENYDLIVVTRLENLGTPVVWNFNLGKKNSHRRRKKRSFRGEVSPKVQREKKIERKRPAHRTCEVLLQELHLESHEHESLTYRITCDSVRSAVSIYQLK